MRAVASMLLRTKSCGILAVMCAMQDDHDELPGSKSSSTGPGLAMSRDHGLRVRDEPGSTSRLRRVLVDGDDVGRSRARQHQDEVLADQPAARVTITRGSHSFVRTNRNFGDVADDEHDPAPEPGRV
jgi:hypothetical protein